MAVPSAAWTRPERRLPVRTIIAAVALLLLPLGASAELRILHLDVGMGDATLILDTESQRSLLVDAGNRGYGRTVVAPTLQALGIEELTYFLATHYDADHIGGVDELVAAGIKVSEAVLDRGDFTNRERKTPTGRATQYGEYLEAAEKFARRTVEPSCEPTIKLGPETQVEAVAAKGRYLRPDCNVVGRTISASNDNDLSIALVLRYGDCGYFIGGDLTGGGNRTTPMEALVAARVGNVDVIKLDHHGSATSTSEALLDELQPEVAIISVGDGGVNRRYRLPRQVVLDRLAALRVKPLVFQTHRGEGGTYAGAFIENRHIAIHTDGVSYTVNGVLRAVDEREEHF